VNTIVSQALALGLPVITTRHSGLPEQVTDGDNGRLVDEGDAEGLAACILELLERPAEIGLLSARARPHVKERYDARLLMDRQVVVYARLTESARRSPPGRKRPQIRDALRGALRRR
jgi:glycosyltransferase involved in cell wall biosynthesis